MILNIEKNPDFKENGFKKYNMLCMLTSDAAEKNLPYCDGMHSFSPISHRDTKQSWASVCSRMRRKEGNMGVLHCPATQLKQQFEKMSMLVSFVSEESCWLSPYAGWGIQCGLMFLLEVVVYKGN